MVNECCDWPHWQPSRVNLKALQATARVGWQVHLPPRIRRNDKGLSWLFSAIPLD